MKNAFTLAIFLLASMACAKSATEYFTKAAALYTEAKLPTAANEAREGLARYPADPKLQKLLQRIEEAQEEQKKQCDKQNPSQDKQQGESSSSGSDQNSSQGEPSSGSQESQPEPQGQSSAGEQSSASEDPGDSTETPLQEGQLNKEQAEQLLKDFQENDKERKRKAKLRGRAAPEKDW